MQLYKSLNHVRTRRAFDPANREDQLELKYFIENKKWRDGCPFFLEFPYLDIPAMCNVRYTEYSLSLMK